MLGNCLGGEASHCSEEPKGESSTGRSFKKSGFAQQTGEEGPAVPPSHQANSVKGGGVSQDSRRRGPPREEGKKWTTRLQMISQWKSRRSSVDGRLSNPYNGRIRESPDDLNRSKPPLTVPERELISRTTKGGLSLKREKKPTPTA